MRKHKEIKSANHYCPHGVLIQECEVECDEHAISCIDSDAYKWPTVDRRTICELVGGH